MYHHPLNKATGHFYAFMTVVQATRFKCGWYQHSMQYIIYRNVLYPFMNNNFTLQYYEKHLKGNLLLTKKLHINYANISTNYGSMVKNVCCVDCYMWTNISKWSTVFSLIPPDYTNVEEDNNLRMFLFCMQKSFPEQINLKPSLKMYFIIYSEMRHTSRF